MSEERNIEKHNLTQEELDFLIELQHELNTQDTVHQADPRFWVVAGTKKVYVGEEYMEEEQLIQGDDTISDCLENAVEYFKEIIENEVTEEDDYYIIIEKEPTKYSSYKVIKIDKNIDTNADDYNKNDEIIMEQNYITCIRELIDALVDANIILENEYDVAYYCNEHYIYPNTMFLTYSSCKKHIELNHHHYDANAHPYAMTALRSPEVEQLWNILQKVDWLKMRDETYGKRYTDSTETSDRNSK